MKTKRQVAIVPVEDKNKYCVRYREKGLLLWGKWSTLTEFGDSYVAWDYAVARKYADQAMSSGVVPDKHSGFVCPIIEVDEEKV